MKLGAAGAQVIRVGHHGHAAGLDLRRCCMRWRSKGITRLLVEGGARVASSFVAADLVDEFWLLRGADPIGADGVAALDALPLSRNHRSRRPSAVRASESLQNDTLTVYERA